MMQGVQAALESTSPLGFGERGLEPEMLRLQPLPSVYSSVMSLHSIRLITFLAKLNGLKLMQATLATHTSKRTPRRKSTLLQAPNLGSLKATR